MALVKAVAVLSVLAGVLNVFAGQSIVVEFAESSYSVSEGAGEVVLIVTANGTSAVNYTVVVDTVDGRATGMSPFIVSGSASGMFLSVDGDYESDSYTVVFQPGETSAELRIPILDDSLGVEGTEDFFATLSIPASSVYLGVSAGSVDSVTVSILDDDNVTVEFSMTEYEVSESTGEVTLYISSDTPGAVNYTLLVYLSNGTAKGGVDYQSEVYNVTVMAEETSAEVSIAIIDDPIVEGNETFTADLSVPVAEAALGVSVSATYGTAYVEIQDDDVAYITFSDMSYQVTEGSGYVTVTLVIGQVSVEFIVVVDITGGTATGD